MNIKSMPFDEWAILEIMGHNRYAGMVSEQTVGGASFVRIDVPPIGNQPAFSKLFGAGSIYCITPCTEDVARITAAGLKQVPLSIYDLPQEIREKISRRDVRAIYSEADEVSEDFDNHSF